MFVETIPIALKEVDESTRVEVSRALADGFGLPVAPGRVWRFAEETASSAVYKCDLLDGGAVVAKRSWWHADPSLGTRAREGGSAPLSIRGDGEVTQAPRALGKAYEVSEALRERGVRLPRAYRASAGGYVHETGGERWVALECVEGQHFSAKDAEFASAGAALGVFHRAGMEYLRAHPGAAAVISSTIPVEKPYEESRKLYLEGSLRQDLLQPHDCGAPEVCAAVREQIFVIDGAIRQIDASGVNSSDRSSGLLHNDFHTNNALFRADGSFAAFLDIDQVGVGPHVWDVGNTLASFASNALSRMTREQFAALARSFLKAYHQTFPLPAREYALVVPATLRWDAMRILRSLRYHHYEGNRLPGLLPKIKNRLIPRIVAAPQILGWITEDWARRYLHAS